MYKTWKIVQNLENNHLGNRVMLYNKIKQSAIGLLLLMGLGIGGCESSSLAFLSGSGSMRVQVDAYKGPLADELLTQWAALRQFPDTLRRHLGAYQITLTSDLSALNKTRFKYALNGKTLKDEKQDVLWLYAHLNKDAQYLMVASHEARQTGASKKIKGGFDKFVKGMMEKECPSNSTKLICKLYQGNEANKRVQDFLDHLKTCKAKGGVEEALNGEATHELAILLAKQYCKNNNITQSKVAQNATEEIVTIMVDDFMHETVKRKCDLIKEKNEVQDLYCSSYVAINQLTYAVDLLKNETGVTPMMENILKRHQAMSGIKEKLTELDPNIKEDEDKDKYKYTQILQEVGITQTQNNLISLCSKKDVFSITAVKITGYKKINQDEPMMNELCYELYGYIALAMRLRIVSHYWSTVLSTDYPRHPDIRKKIINLAVIAGVYSEELQQRADTLLKQLNGFNQDNVPLAVKLRNTSYSKFVNLYTWHNASKGSGFDNFAEITPFWQDNYTSDIRTDRVRAMELLYDSQSWERINEVQASGRGEFSLALVKDNIGNWKLKQYSSDPSELLGAYFKVGETLLDTAAKLAAKAANPASGATASAVEALTNVGGEIISAPQIQNPNLATLPNPADLPALSQPSELQNAFNVTLGLLSSHYDELREDHVTINYQQILIWNELMAMYEHYKDMHINRCIDKNTLHPHDPKKKRIMAWFYKLGNTDARRDKILDEYRFQEACLKYLLKYITLNADGQALQPKEEGWTKEVEDRGEAYSKLAKKTIKKTEKAINELLASYRVLTK